jgi:hypothetical protein
VVSHGRTGFVVDSVDEMTRAVELVGELDSKTIREEVARRFSASRLVQGYLSAYRTVLEEPVLPAPAALTA